MENLLGKDFKITGLKMLRELNQDVDKVKKTMYEQKENINNEIKTKRQLNF